MTAARTSSRDLPLAPTLLCLLGAGWVSSAVVSSAFVRGGTSAVSPFAVLVGSGLVEALVGAVVIRFLLIRVVGLDISYGSAFVALAGGSLVSNGIIWATSTATQHSGAPGVVPSGGLAFSLLPALAGVGVSYWLLQIGARARTTTPTHTWTDSPSGRASDAWADEAPAQNAPQARRAVGGSSYDELVSAARETSLGLVESVSRVTPAEVPDLIMEGLPTLQAIAASLESATAPVAVPARVHEQLISGLKQLQDDLVETSASAVATTNNTMTQRGWLLPRSVDVSDGGTRYRYELSLSQGMKMVREALSELYNLGVGTGW